MKFIFEEPDQIVREKRGWKHEKKKKKKKNEEADSRFSKNNKFSGGGWRFPSIIIYRLYNATGVIMHKRHKTTPIVNFTAQQYTDT